MPQVPGTRHLEPPAGQPGTPRRPTSVRFPPDRSRLERTSRSPPRPLISQSPPAHPTHVIRIPKGDPLLVLTVSLVLLLGVLVWFLIRYAGLRGWHALLCVLFGFYLASTPLAPYIRTGCSALARFIAGVDF